MTVFEETLDSWLDFNRPKEFGIDFYETDYDKIYGNLYDLKNSNKEGSKLALFVGYSKQILFPCDFNLIREKKGFMKIVRTPGETTEEEYLRFRPKRLIAKLTPFLDTNCVLISSDLGDLKFSNKNNDFLVESEGVYAPFDKGKSLFDKFNLVYNVSKQNTPILFLPKGSVFFERKKRNKLLRESWHYIRTDAKNENYIN